MNPPTPQDTKHGLKSCTHYIRRVVLKNTGVSSGSMSETRVVSAASDSCSGACNSGAHVQHAEQGDAIGGREHDDDRRSRRGRHAQLDRAGGRHNDEDEHQPLQSTYRSWASSTIPRATTSVDARTACSGTSSTAAAGRLVLEGSTCAAAES